MEIRIPAAGGFRGFARRRHHVRIDFVVGESFLLRIICAFYGNLEGNFMTFFRVLTVKYRIKESLEFDQIYSQSTPSRAECNDQVSF